MNFNAYFAEIPRLETQQLILRAFTREDMDVYLKIINDSRLQRFLGGGVPVFSGEPHITNWLNNVNKRLLKSKTVLTWCIEQKSDGVVVGRIDLGGFVRKSMADIAYYLSPMVWGRGLATQAVATVTEFGLRNLGLHRIQATVMPENTASIRVLEKNGYNREGLLRKYQMGKEFHDVIMLAIVDEENL